MEVLIVLTFACFQNYMRAKLANLNPVKWTVFTVLAFFGALLTGAIFMVFLVVSRNPGLVQALQKPPVSSQVMQQYIENSGLVFPNVFLIICGVGGYLLIRYILDKKVKVQP